MAYGEAARHATPPNGSLRWLLERVKSVERVHGPRFCGRAWMGFPPKKIDLPFWLGGVCYILCIARGVTAPIV